MPVYEFYCPDCHAVYNFFSSRVNTSKRPDCPVCRRPRLERQVSPFAAPRGRSPEHPDLGPEPDQDRLEKAMDLLAREGRNLDQEDPRQAAAVMRRLSEAAGLDMGSGMQEVLARLEAGEDPEKVEAEMGEVLDGEGLPQVQGAGGGLVSRSRPPARDDKLYDL